MALYCSLIIMVNPVDGTYEASRNKTNEILTVYLRNRSVYKGLLRIKKIYSRININVRMKEPAGHSPIQNLEENGQVSDSFIKRGVS